jgi:aspartyl-tRNA(Asn)/glutamyl-tRNA(Gln) amidotransferase subunit A
VLANAATPVIGVVAPYFMDTCEPDILEHFTSAIRVLEAAGADVREVALPATFSRIAPTFDAIAWAETAAYHEQQFAVRGSLYGPKISALIQQGARTTAADYVRAMRERHLVVADLEDMLTDVDVLLTPATPAPAPRNTSTTGDPAYQTPWSYAGLPAVSLPSGVNTWGLPLGVQLIGSRWQDAQLLQSAAWCEQALAFTAHPPCW